MRLTSYVKYKLSLLHFIYLRIANTNIYICYNILAACIQAMTVNSTQDTLLVTTSRTQLFMSKIWGPDVPQVHLNEFTILGEPIHQGSILSLAVCAWKPIFLTSGADRTIRVWNYESGEVEMIKRYAVGTSYLNISSA